MKELIFYKGFPLSARSKARNKVCNNIKTNAPLTPNNPNKTANLSNNKMINRCNNIVVLGLGGNIGNVARRFFYLILWLLNNPHFNLLNTTPIYKNPAFGYTKQDDFLNALIVLKTSLNINSIYKLVFYLERKFGRERKRMFKNAPRTLDIDIIFYNQLILKRPYLTIPHQKYQNRSSVLLPMMLYSKEAK